MDSGTSAGRTTVVLGKSASWKVAAARGEVDRPYTSFAPLEDLVDAVTEAAVPVPGLGGVGATATALAAQKRAAASAAGKVVAAGDAKPSHRVTLATMLLPGYIETPMLERYESVMSV
jgi:hypothetical protein